jgi:hypothetical protein
VIGPIDDEIAAVAPFAPQRFSDFRRVRQT